MTDDRETLAGFGGTARLFPLPGLVLFPGGTQPLHIFEARYRQMTADALAGDGTIAMALLQDDWEATYDRTPAIHPVGCLGRIVRHERLPDGRYNLLLRGLSRVRFGEELTTGKLYRTARSELIADDLPADLAELTALRRDLAGRVLGRLPAGEPAHAQLLDLFAGESTLGEICDSLAFRLPFSYQFKQMLLEEPVVLRRAEYLLSALHVRPADDRAFPPGFSAN